MKIKDTDLLLAVKNRVITKKQMEDIISIASLRSGSSPSFDVTHLLYYLGALVVIGAMGLFMTLGWERFGGGGIMSISLAYALLFAVAGYIFWFRKKMSIAGGLFFTMAVSMTPLIVYGFERMLGVWPMDNPGTYHDYHVWINGSWIMMELATIGVGLIVLAFVRFPFLTMPVAFAFWYLSMDLTPLFFGRNEFIWEERLIVSAVVGSVIIIISYIIDRFIKEDFAFWGYLFGLFSLWGGLSLMNSDSQLNKFLYCMLNIFFMLLSIWLGRRAFMVFGGLGVFGYLGYLSWDVFEDSLIFPFALSLLGIILIIFAVLYQKNEKRITSAVNSLMPALLQRLRPPSRE